MNPPEIKVALITGANTGIGKEIARQLGLLSSTEKIYLACRNESKAQAKHGQRLLCSGEFTRCHNYNPFSSEPPSHLAH